MRLGPIDLTVTGLDRSVGFYQDALGLRVNGREDGRAALGAGGDDLLVLHEDPNARPAGRHAGLFHFALLHPTREELARAVQRLAVARTPVTGASDHGVSEAIYLSDPDGNGIELYSDRPRESWPPPRHEGERVGMFTEPLDVEGLLALVDGRELVPHASEGLVAGHMHLHVNDLEEAVRFYRDVVGLEEMARYPGAAFLARDGYHHHVAVNVWRGEGIPPVPPDAVGLRRFALIANGGEPEELTDPAGNRLLLRR
jgi:catechol 2,3-dioxygenase